MSVIWHDLECGSYREDLRLWRELSAEYGDPVLDVGAGTGRVAVDLARAGHAVTALDRDPALLAELDQRAAGLPLRSACADARNFTLPDRYALILVPMQTIQLLGGASGRSAFLRSAAAHLRDGGAVVIAIAEELELFELEDGAPGPLPDVCELAGVVYSSQPTAVRFDGDGVLLERRRETIGIDGTRELATDLIRLDRLGADTVEHEASAAGLHVGSRRTIPPSADYVGSEVVLLHG